MRLMALVALGVFWASFAAAAFENECQELLQPPGPLFELTKVHPKIFHLSFPSRRSLTSSFLRFQEHYESPKFRGKVFSRTQFKKWYRAENGAFSYYTDWQGFNLPSYVFRPFLNGEFKKLSAAEQALLEKFRELPEPYYVIGTSKGNDSETLDHETAHGLFYVDADYRNEVLKVLDGIDTRDIEKWLGEKGYHPAVFKDEVNAYLSENNEYLAENGLDLAPYRPAMLKLRALFVKFRSQP